MKLELVVLKDAKSRVYGVPAVNQTLDEALRSFAALINDKADTLPARFPADFDLWHIGSYDNDTGLITAASAPVHLANGLDVKIDGKAVIA